MAAPCHKTSEWWQRARAGPAQKAQCLVNLENCVWEKNSYILHVAHQWANFTHIHVDNPDVNFGSLIANVLRVELLVQGWDLMSQAVWEAMSLLLKFSRGFPPWIVILRIPNILGRRIPHDQQTMLLNGTHPFQTWIRWPSWKHHGRKYCQCVKEAITDHHRRCLDILIDDVLQDWNSSQVLLPPVASMCRISKKRPSGLGNSRVSPMCIRVTSYW